MKGGADGRAQNRRHSCGGAAMSCVKRHHDRRALFLLRFRTLVCSPRLTYSETMLRISERALADLENAYRDGENVTVAAREAGTSRHTATRYYCLFAANNVPGGRHPRGGPRYRGPVWIGVRAGRSRA